MTEDNAMFHITLITVGKLKERYYAAAADEYIRRLGAYCKFELIELPECRLPDDPNGTQIAAGLAREAEQIEAKLPRGAWFCVLTPEGTELSSEGLAERLQAEKLNGRSAACFLIGSSFGIDARIKRMADFRLSFSKMTFPHHLMRVMALEQLYRAESILAGIFWCVCEDFKAIFCHITTVLNTNTNFFRNVNTWFNRETHSFFDYQVISFHD